MKTVENTKRNPFKMVTINTAITRLHAIGLRSASKGDLNRIAIANVADGTIAYIRKNQDGTYSPYSTTTDSYNGYHQTATAWVAQSNEFLVRCILKAGLPLKKSFRNISK